MVTVYRAAHLHFKEELAIKVVSSALTADQDFLNRFKREAVITRKLRHPNAVRLDDFDFTEDGRPFIAMEYVRGKSLRQVLQENGALPVARAFNLARQVALALGAAHELGIVHRDIKPDNIVLVPQADGSEVVKVLDFGIAKVADENLDGATSYKPTSTGMVLGEPHYVAPEQAKGKRTSMIDGRADLHALAAAAGAAAAKTSATSAVAAETRVLGSQAMTVQSTAPAAVDAAIARVAGAIAPKRKRWILWAAAAAALVVAIWAGSAMLNRSS